MGGMGEAWGRGGGLSREWGGVGQVRKRSSKTFDLHIELLYSRNAIGKVNHA
jgi:hypothetical protein